MSASISPTHNLSATTSGEVTCSGDGDCPGTTTCGSDGVCVDAYDTPITGPTDSVGGSAGDPVAVRFHPQGARINLDLVRQASGEDVQRSPMIEAPATLATLIEEGDTLALAALADGHEDYVNLEAHAVIEIYGPQRARPRQTIVETEDV